MYSYKYNYSYLSSHRFLTYYCLLYNETSWCQPGSQPPLIPTNSQTQLQSLTYRTDPTTTEHAHSQSSTKAISQQLSANATKGDQDKSSEFSTSYSSIAINHPKISKLPNSNVHPQRFNHAYLQKLNATTSD